mmetsp:Transcript_90610/g.110909  ORF Transcript_90610/g.110909 Transcript_90610/m.110909 type:complete len:152 (+) Transcript_90610:24-479(+)
MNNEFKETKINDKNSLEYKVLWEAYTEDAFTGKYLNHFPKNGYYGCKSCGNPLYSWKAKFDSKCGWPAFDKCFINSIKINQNDVDKHKIGIEILCNKCNAHLGHIFKSKKGRSNQRHCVNSISIKYYKIKQTYQETDIKIVKTKTIKKNGI